MSNDNTIEPKTDWPEALRAWTKTDSRELPIEEICETLEAYDALKAKCERLEWSLDLRTNELHAVLEAAQKVKARLEAQCAEMRSALEAIANIDTNASASKYADLPDIAHDVLSRTDCGKAILARLEEARRLMEESKTSPEPANLIEGWRQRRDQWLSQK